MSCKCVGGSSADPVDMAHSADTEVDADRRNEWVVIGISGVTCGGKTTLARRLLAALAPAYVFHQDQYFYPDADPRHVRAGALAHNNYDVLSALDMAALLAHVRRALAGDAAHAHARALDAGADGKFSLPGKKFLIVEGFTVLNYRPIWDLCDLRYYFVLEYGECCARRALRLYEPADVEGYFELCVWPEHLKYRAEMEKCKGVTFLDGAQPGAFETVMADLKKLAT